MPDPNILKIEKHKIAFMFVNKAANSSVKRVIAEKLLGKGNGKDVVLSWSEPFHEDVEFTNRISIPHDYLIFGTCRHPEDRLISCWKDKVRNGFKLHEGLYKSSRKFYKDMPFAEFVKEISLIKYRSKIWDQHIRPQWHDLDLKRISYLIKVENFINDWENARAMIKTHCGETYPQMIFHDRNTGLSKPRISKKTRSLIEKIYAKDYRILNYKSRA